MSAPPRALPTPPETMGEGRLLEGGLRYFHAETDNAILLVPRHTSMRELTEGLAAYISGYGLARSYVLGAPPRVATWPVDPSDWPPLLGLLPPEEAQNPLLLGCHEPDGRLELGFVSGRYGTGGVPFPRTFQARDGAWLAYHHVPTDSDRVVIVVHGASAHGRLYAPLARFLAHRGLAHAYVPTLRGHHLSGGRPGDVDHASQLEDDLADLIARIRRESPRARIVLAGHSMGAGLVLRFARGPHAGLVEGYLLLAPYLGPFAPTVRAGGAGGWVRVRRGRALGLAALNSLGIRAWNSATLLEFDLPMPIRDGTEVLRYSYRMAAAMTPGLDYRHALRSLARPALVLVGSQDEMFEPEAYRAAFRSAALARVQIVRQASHLGLVFHAEAHRLCEDWLRETFPT